MSGAGYSPARIGRALDVLRHEAAPPEKGGGAKVGAKVGEKGGENAATNAGENAGERLTDNQQRILILLRQNRYPDLSRVPPRNVIDYTYPQPLSDEWLSIHGQISTRTGGQNSTHRNTNR